MTYRLIKAEGAGALRRAAPLFDGWQETAVWSALQQEMGCVWTLSDLPRAALCESADFLFLAGEAQEAETEQILRVWQQERAGKFAILIPRDPVCAALIESIFGAAAKPEKRFAFQKGGESFDRIALEQLAAKRPADVQLRPFDRELYAAALQADWSRDFVSQFRDAEDYLKRGIGVVALRGGRMVGGASSYTVYRGGIEVQIETHSDHRRQGIAAACGAQLILNCMDRGLYPSWDAANEVSAHLARKLGYRDAGPYACWELY